MSRECQMGLAAAIHALNDASIAEGGYEPERTGIVYGSDLMLSPPDEFTSGMHLCSDHKGQFDFSRWGSEGMWEMTPLWLLKYLPNMPACHIAIYFDLRGPNNSITQREASSMLAVGEAFRTITRGHADVMIAGATGTRVHPMKTLHSVQQEEIAGKRAGAGKRFASLRPEPLWNGIGRRCRRSRPGRAQRRRVAWGNHLRRDSRRRIFAGGRPKSCCAPRRRAWSTRCAPPCVTPSAPRRTSVTSTLTG